MPKAQFHRDRRFSSLFDMHTHLHLTRKYTQRNGDMETIHDANQVDSRMFEFILFNEVTMFNLWSYGFYAFYAFYAWWLGTYKHKQSFVAYVVRKETTWQQYMAPSRW